MERDAEIALARSAAPESISRDAGVMVLGQHGYETAVQGKNGFMCLVERGWSAPLDDPSFWNPKLRGPICFNAAAVRSYVPISMKRTESILASLDGGIELAGGTAGHVYLGSRIIRGWAIELVLLTTLVPFLVGAIDLFARSRRRRLPLPGAWRALRTRFGVWLWIVEKIPNLKEPGYVTNAAVCSANALVFSGHVVSRASGAPKVMA